MVVLLFQVVITSREVEARSDKAALQPAKLRLPVFVVDSKYKQLEKRVTSLESQLEKRVTSLKSQLEKRVTSVESQLDKRVTSLESAATKCATGTFFDVGNSQSKEAGFKHNTTISFSGFKVAPTVTASLASFKRWQQGTGDTVWGIFLSVTNVKKSSAKILVGGHDTSIYDVQVSWVACA